MLNIHSARVRRLTMMFGGRRRRDVRVGGEELLAAATRAVKV
jgi:hypothetical protein